MGFRVFGAFIRGSKLLGASWGGWDLGFRAVKGFKGLELRVGRP